MITASDATALRATIGSETARVCAKRYPNRLRSIVLTGSLARDEGTWRAEGGGAKVLGDAEFLVVLADDAPLPEPAMVRSIAEEVEARLAAVGIACPVTLSPVHAVYLRRLRPAIFSYELQTCGQPVWGDPAILALVPPMNAADIPLEDAWRLLCNRLVEQIEAVPGVRDGSCSADAGLYRTAKLVLDMATSFLVFAGQYEPTYRLRAERLRALAREPASSDRHPFRLEPFARLVSACTDWKLDGGDGAAPDGVSWDGVMERARRLWRWELVRLSGSSPELSDPALMEVWLRRQPARERARGWLHLLRRCGWHRSWRLWPRWARLVRRGSPRYLVYNAACRLLFELPRPDDERGGGMLEAAAGWKRLWEDLPVISPAAGQRPALPWQEAAFAIAWCYHEFLVGTRA
jgi:hypothetical protein